MGIHGGLVVSEDTRQQQVIYRCFELTKEQMGRSSAELVAKMLKRKHHSEILFHTSALSPGVACTLKAG